MAENNTSNLLDEESIFQLVETGQKEEAKKALFDLIVEKARQGDFVNAERLRERLYEIDPMALIEIISSGEIIEQEKGNAIDGNVLETWEDLSKILTPGEFQTMYHESEEVTFGPDETIVSQGDRNDSLYFIDKGRVTVSHRIKDKQLFITTLEAGSVIGESFFYPSVWTVSLTAQTQAGLHMLKQEHINKWQADYPDVKRKLKAYYEKKNTVSGVLKEKGLERRRFKRFSLARKILVKPVDKAGNAYGGGFRAELMDVSAGGLSFLMRITKEENAKLLLGRKLQITVPVGDGKKGVQLKGISAGVQLHDAFENDYSVHMQFQFPLSEKILTLLLADKDGV